MTRGGEATAAEAPEATAKATLTETITPCDYA